MHLALFDLDHTLIGFDSGNAFARFLMERGALARDFEPQYLDYCRQYAAGSLDMRVMHRYTVGALAQHPPSRLSRWLSEFEQTMAPRIEPAARALVQHHRDAGHACALVTATTRFVAEPFARLLDLPVVLATEPEMGADGRYTGEVQGVPCFRADKLVHVRAWLQRQGASLAQARDSWFYSESINDLPLLEAVSQPVAVNPDAALAVLAAQRGWRVIKLR
jgi:HAD superfamily hydrolase (TIGR01490 family)